MRNLTWNFLSAESGATLAKHGIMIALITAIAVAALGGPSKGVSAATSLVLQVAGVR